MRRSVAEKLETLMAFQRSSISKQTFNFHKLFKFFQKVFSTKIPNKRLKIFIPFLLKIHLNITIILREGIVII